MAEHGDMKMHSDEQAAPATTPSKAFTARRKFLRQTLAAASGVALAELLPSFISLGSAQQLQCPVGAPFVPVGEIRSNGNKLQAVLRVLSGNRKVPTTASLTSVVPLRYYSGYNTANPGVVWPPNPTETSGPGPTFRCNLGDQVQITFMNQVRISDFPASMFQGEKGTSTGCDEATTGSDPHWYPQTAGDTFPNCFHASSAANIHFHGLHVSPATVGDNVLVNIWPNPNQNAADVQKAFKPIYDNGDRGQYPQKWRDLPQGWRDLQMGPEAQWPNGPNKGQIGYYDANAPYNNKRGLPPELQLWPVNYSEINDGQWAQYYIGAYPYCFQIPRFLLGSGLKMGQAPGTHWYHSHKHGSTSINLFNGMAGAFIIEDNTPNGYDGKLNAFYRGQLQQVVLVLQQITPTINVMGPGGASSPKVLVNGQFTPVLTMKPGQVQLWRVINACVQKAVTFQFDACFHGDVPPQYRQTAQDGVQFAFANYINLNRAQLPINVAPANRVDALVQAPSKPGTYIFGTATNPIAFIKVEGTAMPMTFPTTEADYPPMPPFLNNITDDEIKKTREIVYGWDKNRQGPGRSATNAAPHFTINGKQFQNGVVDETMKLDTAEEWKISNQTNVQHPFHIHVNPFQIIELYDPNKMSKPLRVVEDVAAAKAADPDGKKDYVDAKVTPPLWWDNFAMPNALQDSNGVVLGDDGYAKTPGYFVMRSRFVDFTGMYVQHCHILAHEDRGMMQLLQVCKDPDSPECKKQAANVKHH